MPNEDSRVKVLVVDDSLDMSDVFCQLINTQTDLKSVGACDSADRLVDAVNRTNAQIVLIDLLMPGRDSLEAISELRTVCSEVRAIVCTGYDHPETIGKAAAAGAWGYVSKNTEPEMIFNAIRHVAQGRTAFPNDAK